MSDKAILFIIIVVVVIIWFVVNDKNKSKERAKRAERERLERIEREKRESERKEKERLKRIEKEQQDRERKENERLQLIEKERKERERIERERKQKEIKLIEIQKSLSQELFINETQRRNLRNSLAEISNYSNDLYNIENPNFTNIRRISVYHINNLRNQNPNYADQLFKKVQGGLDIFTTSDELHQYKFSFDLKHNTKLNNAFQLFFNQINLKNIQITGNIDIIDWGCGQALASFLFIDYLRSNNINNFSINKIILIEPSEIAVKRGVAIINKIVSGTNFSPFIKIVNKKLEDVNDTDIFTYNENIKLHLFSNIIDLPKLNVNQIYSNICKSQRNKNYFICVSPNFMPNGVVIDNRNKQMIDFELLFKNEFEYEQISYRTDTILENDTKRFEIMFYAKIDHLPDNINKEIQNNICDYNYVDDLPF